MTNQQIAQKLKELCSLLLAKVPKGFENFLPKNARSGNKAGFDGEIDGNNDSSDGDDDEDKDSDKKTKEAKKESSKKSTESSSGGGGGGFGNKNKKRQRDEHQRKKREEEDMQQQLAGTTLLLILVLVARSFFDDESSGSGGGSLVGGDGPEVTWSDFYNYMLTEGDVERIVVVNKKTARVYLRQGARGVPVSASSGGKGAGLVRQVRSAVGMSSGVKNTANESAHMDEHWDDETVMEMGHGPATAGATPSGIGLPSSFGGGGASVGNRKPQHQLVYHFNIGSVESFEDKLTHSQQELGVSPRNYVPVQYASETNWAIELVKSAPALFLIGVTAYMLRS